MILSLKNKYLRPQVKATSLSGEQFLCQSTEFPGSSIEDMNVTDLGWDDNVFNLN